MAPMGEKHIWLMVIGGALAVAAIIWMFVVSIGPCHSQHAELRYYKAYNTRHCSAYMPQKIGEVTTQQCIAWRTDHHPAHCAWVTVCDERCNDFDKTSGNREGHPKHKTLQNPSITFAGCPIGSEDQGNN